MHCRPGRGIQIVVSGIVVRILAYLSHAWFACLWTETDSRAGLVNIFINTSCHPSQQCSSIGWAFIDQGSNDRTAEHICEQLTPELTARTTSCCTDFGWGRPELQHDLE